LSVVYAKQNYNQDLIT